MSDTTIPCSEPPTIPCAPPAQEAFDAAYRAAHSAIPTRGERWFLEEALRQMRLAHGREDLSALAALAAEWEVEE